MRLPNWAKKGTLAVLLLFLCVRAPAATVPTGFTESLVASGLSSPTAMDFAPDGRLFVCEQGGRLMVVKNGVLLSTAFVNLTVDINGERGLLGVAFDPNFAANHYVYVYYTATSPAIHNRVSRFTANGDVAVAGSELVLLDLNNLSAASNHNGGAIHFGLDGKLYIGVGDNANSANSQTLTNLLGKMLRINADGSIPTDNPFYNTASGVNRAIWALGLRNPFTFAVHSGTGRLFINDVGENTWEEIDDGIAGSNYGWPNCEGICSPSNPAYRDPIYQYQHGAGGTMGYCIAGGAFYNPGLPGFPSNYFDDYFFADYVNGWIRVLDPATGYSVSAFASNINGPVDLKLGPDARLYYLARGSGTVMAISYSGSQAPQITQQPVDQTVFAGQPATFSVGASGAPPLNYQWRRNGASISGATTNVYTLASTTVSDDGAAFACVVTNSSGSVTSNPALLHVSTNNPPVPTIITPTNGTLYAAGDTIQYVGTATDAEDGILPPTAYSWTIVFHHDTHTHPFLGPITGVTNGSFTIPTLGETSTNVWYRISLTVTDSVGQSTTNFCDIRPRTAVLFLASSPPGLQVTLDGQPLTTPAAVGSVVGMQRTLGVITPQTVNGTNYGFNTWSDGGAASHVISTPDTDTTYTASFQVLPPGATLFADDFTRSTNPGPLAPWRVNLGTWAISNGTLNGASPPQTYGYAYISNSWTDYTVEGRVQFPTNAYGGGLGGRLDPVTGAHYAAWLYPEGSAGGSRVLKLKKQRDWTTWSQVPMQQVSLPAVGTNWHSLKMIFQGNRIQVLLDGAPAIDVTDNGFDSRAAYLSGGITAGLWSYTSGSMIRVDDVVVSSLSTNQPAITNQPPVANSDSYGVVQNTPLNVSAPGVLGNDTDPNGDPLSALLVSGTTNGTVTLNSDGSLAYTPLNGYTGPDSFTYSATDGRATSAVALVSLTVSAPSPNLFSDDFTRSTNPGPLAPWRVSMGTWSVSNGMLNGSSSRQQYGYVYLTNLWTDYSVEARVQFPANAYGGGIGGRLNTANGSHYAAWIYPEGSSGGSRVLKLKKQRDWTTWSQVPMQQVSLSAVGTNWHTLKMIFQGSRIQVMFDGTPVVDVTDSGFDGRAAYLTGGIDVGVWTYTSLYTMRADDVTVAPLVSPLAAPLPVDAGTHPIQVAGLDAIGGRITLQFPTRSGTQYVAEFKESLQDPAWQTLTSVVGTGSPGTIDDSITVATSRFYRVRPLP